MTQDLNDQQIFRHNVLSLKKSNPSWTPAKIADEFQKYEVPPTLSRKALRLKIKRILDRGTIKDKPCSGRKRTVATKELSKKI